MVKLLVILLFSCSVREIQVFSCDAKLIEIMRLKRWDNRDHFQLTWDCNGVKYYEYRMFTTDTIGTIKKVLLR